MSVFDKKNVFLIAIKHNRLIWVLYGIFVNLKKNTVLFLAEQMSCAYSMKQTRQMYFVLFNLIIVYSVETEFDSCSKPKGT